MTEEPEVLEVIDVTHDDFGPLWSVEAEEENSFPSDYDSGVLPSVSQWLGINTNPLIEVADTFHGVAAATATLTDTFVEATPHFTDTFSHPVYGLTDPDGIPISAPGEATADFIRRYKKWQEAYEAAKIHDAAKKKIAEILKPTSIHDYIILDPDLQSFQTNKNTPMSFETLNNRIGAVTPELGLLPPVVRYISPWKKGEAVVIVESKPQIFNMHLLDEIIAVPLPWIHWMLTIRQSNTKDLTAGVVEQIGIAFSKSKLTSLDHTFYPPYTPNILHGMKSYMHPFYTGFWNICYGAFKDDHDDRTFKLGIKDGECSLAEIFQDLSADYLSTIFNNEASHIVAKYTPLVMKDDPDFKWNEHDDYQSPNQRQSLIQFFKELSTWKIERVLEELVGYVTEISLYSPIQTFETIVNFYEAEPNAFQFGRFLSQVKNINETHKAPVIISSATDNVVTDLEDNSSPIWIDHTWSEDDCENGIGGDCPSTHYRQDGEHK